MTRANKAVERLIYIVRDLDLITKLEAGELNVESGITYETVRGLMEKRHEVGFERGGYGGYQAIMWDKKNKVYRGASESRKDGQASGY